MKNRAFAFVILFVLLTFCSCGSKEEVFFDRDFEASVCYTRLGKEFTAVYARDGERETLRFLSPKTVENLYAARENGSVTVNFDNLSFTSASDIFSPFDLLARCTAKASGENTYISDGGVTVITLGGTPKEVTRGEIRLNITEYKITERSGTR